MRNLLLGAVLCSALLWAPGDAAASVCLAQVPSEPPTDPATTVFVGTAVETEAFEQNALVHVEEIWYGGPLAEWQAVLGVETDHEIRSGITRFAAGKRYVVVATRDGSRLDSNCSTSLYTSRLAERRPDQVSAPTAVARPLLWGLGVSTTIAWGLPALVAIVLIVIGAVGLYRLRDSDTPSLSPLIR